MRVAVGARVAAAVGLTVFPATPGAQAFRLTSSATIRRGNLLDNPRTESPLAARRIVSCREIIEGARFCQAECVAA